MRSTLPSALSALLFVLAAFVDGLRAQDPRGQLIVSCFNPGTGVFAPGNGRPGGLFLVHPRTPGMPVTVTGLPCELTGSDNSGQPIQGSPYSIGCSGIAALPDGDLLVGEVAPPSGSMLCPDSDLEVHRIRLVWSQGVWSAHIVQSYFLATVLSGNAVGEVTDLEVLPGGQQALLSLHGPLSAPLAGAKVAILDLATGVPTPIVMSSYPVGSGVNAMALSAVGLTAYLGELHTTGGNIWQLPLPTAPPFTATAVPLTTSPSMGGVMAMDRDNAGDLLVGTWGFGGITAAAPNVHVVNSATGAITDLLPGATGIRNAMLVERNTGDYMIGTRPSHLDAAGVLTLLVPNSLTVPWGLPGGFAMIPAIEPFGSQSTCAPGSYGWQTLPNPGGLPLVGNAGFSITVATPAPESAAVFALGFTPLPAPALLPACAQLLIAPLTTALVLSPAPTTTFTLALPIPNDARLVGTRVLGQSLHLSSGSPLQLASSPGLGFTIL